MSNGFTSPEHGPEIFDMTDCAKLLATHSSEVFAGLTYDMQGLTIDDIESDTTGCLTSTWAVKQTLPSGVCIILGKTDYLDLELEPGDPEVDVQTMLSVQLARTTDYPGRGAITQRSDFYVNLTDAEEASEFPDRDIQLEIGFHHMLINESGEIIRTRAKMSKRDIGEAIMLMKMASPTAWEKPDIDEDEQTTDDLDEIPVQIRTSSEDSGSDKSVDVYPYEAALLSDESIKNTRWLLAALAGSIAVAFSSGTPEPVQTILQEGGLMAIVPSALHFYMKVLRDAHTK